MASEALTVNVYVYNFDPLITDRVKENPFFSNSERSSLPMSVWESLMTQFPCRQEPLQTHEKLPIVLTGISKDEGCL